MSVWVQFTWIKASRWAHRNFHFQNKTIFCHGLAITVCTRPVIVKETAVLLSPIPATSRGTPDRFYKHMSQIIALRLHLDCFDKWEHTKMLLQFSLDESFLLASASELFVRAFVLSWRRLLFPFLDALLMLDCWNRKVRSWVWRLKKNVKLYTPWG